MFMRSARRFERAWPAHRLAHDHAFGERDAGERAELRVAALDQLPERRRGQPRRNRIAVGAAGVNWLR